MINHLPSDLWKIQYFFPFSHKKSIIFMYPDTLKKFDQVGIMGLISPLCRYRKKKKNGNTWRLNAMIFMSLQNMNDLTAYSFLNKV